MREINMQHFNRNRALSLRLVGKTLFCCGAVLLGLAGCGGDVHSGQSTSPDSPSGPANYFAPFVSGTTNGGSTLSYPELYTIDDSAKTFDQTNFQLNPPLQQGQQVINAGVMDAGTPNAANTRGLLSLGITANYTPNSTTNLFDAHPPAKSGSFSFAVELPNQAGGFIQIVGQPAAPLAPATTCPSSSTAKTWQFITIPAPQFSSISAGGVSWDPTTDTAYGTVDISGSGATVSFKNIQQFTLPSAGGTGVPAQPSASAATGTCASTFFGDITSLPGQLVITAPGQSNTAPPQAMIGIGPTGFLVEDNRAYANTTLPDTNPALHYNNVLGAGSGAIGMPQPASQVDTSALAGARYLGFAYGAGIYNANSGSGWNSHLTSFGFSTTPSSCASLVASSSTILYGGDYTTDDPSSSSDGFGNCDLALDLGAQDSAHNGLFPHATVWIGASYAGNTSGTKYSFSAVAIAGQLNEKNAIFVIGADSKQPWAIYLLQSN